MNVYIYQAALYCEACATQIKATLIPPNQPDDEYTFDSDDYPKGPYPASESDSPDHCDKCGVFLENPLTGDGYNWLTEQDNTELVKAWKAYYGIE